MATPLSTHLKCESEHTNSSVIMVIVVMMVIAGWFARGWRGWCSCRARPGWMSTWSMSWGVGRRHGGIGDIRIRGKMGRRSSWATSRILGGRSRRATTRIFGGRSRRATSRKLGGRSSWSGGSSTSWRTRWRQGRRRGDIRIRWSPGRLVGPRLVRSRALGVMMMAIVPVLTAVEIASELVTLRFHVIQVSSLVLNQHLGLRPRREHDDESTDCDHL